MRIDLDSDVRDVQIFRPNRVDRWFNFKPYFTYALIAINTILLLWTNFTGASYDPTLMLEAGGLNSITVLERGEIFRLISSTFLHYGFNHLLHNMLSLLILGYYLERYLGSIPFLVLYLLSGIVGNIASLFLMPEYVVSAGASGAVFGLMGVGIAFYQLQKHNFTMRLEQQMKAWGFIIVLNLLWGFMDSSINNVAHLFGLAGGYVLTYLIIRISTRGIRH